MIAHISGIPVEELLPWLSSVGATLLAARVWTTAMLARVRRRGDDRDAD